MAQKTYIVAAISTAVNRCWSCGLSEILNLELPAAMTRFPIFGPHFPRPTTEKQVGHATGQASVQGPCTWARRSGREVTFPPHVLTRQYGSCAYCCQ